MRAVFLDFSTVSNGDLDPAPLEREPPPHVAWAAREARQRCLDELALNVESFLAGGRRNRVD